MKNITARFSDSCLCGKRMVSPEGTAVEGQREVRCPCGRVGAFAPAGTALALEAVFTPERSVPVRGFSRELRLEPDVERFWFLHPIGGATLPVHVVFCASLKIAEVKAADMKALRLEDVSSVSQARRAWIDRRASSREASKTARARAGEGSRTAAGLATNNT